MLMSGAVFLPCSRLRSAIHERGISYALKLSPQSCAYCRIKMMKFLFRVSVCTLNEEDHNPSVHSACRYLTACTDIIECVRNKTTSVCALHNIQHLRRGVSCLWRQKTPSRKSPVCRQKNNSYSNTIPEVQYVRINYNLIHIVSCFTFISRIFQLLSYSLQYIILFTRGKKNTFNYSVSVYYEG